MPREPSKCKTWEKERRDRLSKSFDELVKLLPSYNPSIKLSKIEILNQACKAISELKEEINVLTNKTENQTFKDELIKKLQDRIKKLILRNEQLNNLFKDAGIKPPTVVGTVKTFKKPGKWSNKIFQSDKISKEKEREKENVSSPNTESKVKVSKSNIVNNVKPSKPRSRPKASKVKQCKKKLSPTKGLLLLSQVPTVPAINQPLVLLPNIPLNGVSQAPTVIAAPPIINAVKTTKTPEIKSVNIGSSGLGPGTLIFKNGSILSVLPQPPVIIPPITQTVVLSKVVKKSKPNQGKNILIKPNRCITKTTQINKLPIPALTSKYANNSVLLTSSPIKQNKRVVNKAGLLKGAKRKACNKNVEAKKAKTDDNALEEINKNSEVEKQNDKENTDVEEVNKHIQEEANKLNDQAKPDLNVSKDETKTDSQELNKHKDTEEALTKKDSTISPQKDTELEKTEISQTKINKVSEEVPTSTSTINESEPVHDDTIKNIDLNLEHSDLSNDIFASLHVPPGCQNTESTSPTAAFLLAFPLVSSMKVTEVIDEENSDSQRETPTLLQIGNMDNSKPNNDGLLNLDNFPFFNSKDLCGGYYNSKVDAIGVENKNTEQRSENSKLENESYIFNENNKQSKEVVSNNDNYKVSFDVFPKRDQNISDTKSKNTDKIGTNQNNSVGNVFNSEQFMLFQDKNNDDNVLNSTNKVKDYQESGQEKTILNKTSNTFTQIVSEKIQSNCNNLLFNIPQETNLLPTESSSNVYKNYSVKESDYMFKNNKNNTNFNASTNKNIQINKFSGNEQLNLCHTLSVKPQEMSNQNLNNCTNKVNKLNMYNYNPFEPLKQKETTLDVTTKQTNTEDKDEANKLNNSKICTKYSDAKAPCYFNSNYGSANYKPDLPKPPPCTFENQRSYSNPFYSNCNYSYNYADANLNQNYYKPETKSCYSLNYENYQEYRKSDTNFNSFSRERKVNNKDKTVMQSKTVNWMTEQKTQASDCFLPSFTNQSYSFSSITTDADNVSDVKKNDLADKRFSWSPTKLPNFLEPPHSFITPTLPTLVGDLALGNPLSSNDSKSDYKYSKETKRKTYDSQANFLSVSQLVNQNKTDNPPARTATRRLSGSKSKNIVQTKKRFDKNQDKNTSKPVNNFEMFYEQKNRNNTKNVLSNYSAEALIGNQGQQDTKKCTDNAKLVCPSNFMPEIPYFTTVDDGYMNQNQNFHNTYSHNSFQNNSYPGNSFIYTTPPINSNYLTTNFDNSHEYNTDNVINYCGLKDNKNCGNNKGYRVNTKEVKKSKKVNQSNIGNFEYPLLPIQGSTNSPILPDDFQSHTTFLPPTTPYPCKNSLYQKQNNEFNAGPLLPLPGISRGGIQHPQVSPSLNTGGTSLTNFNLSTIFPEINKGINSNLQTSSNNKPKSNSDYLQGSFNDSKYGFSSC